MKAMEFSHVSKCQDGAGHSIGISLDGKTAYSWSNYVAGSGSAGGNKKRQGPVNYFGQMGVGRFASSGNDRKKSTYNSPTKIVLPDNSVALSFVRAFTGGTAESGHSALLDSTRRRLYLCGCDRWQQLGLGSASGGSVGYTWRGGRLWQDVFQLNEHLENTMFGDDSKTTIRDVALGGDHTVVLSDNGKDVFTFGRGGCGQLGVVGKPYVSAPVKATILSAKKHGTIAAVCAIRDCSATLGQSGEVIKTAGKCNPKLIYEGLLACQERAKRDRKSVV